MGTKHVAPQSHSPDTPEPSRPTSALGTLVRTLRQEAGLTISELAARSGYERSNLRRVETGKMVALAHHNIRKIADALDADIEDFYDAIWHDTQEPLPSLPVYFRHRYRDLTDRQIAEIERIVSDMHRRNQHDTDTHP